MSVTFFIATVVDYWSWVQKTALQKFLLLEVNHPSIPPLSLVPAVPSVSVLFNFKNSTAYKDH